MSEFSRWIFDFETPKDWEPGAPWCWINCPISILAPLDKPCPGRNPKLDICPIKKRAERIRSLAEMYESESIEDKIENVEKIIWYVTHLKEELEEMKGEKTNEN